MQNTTFETCCRAVLDNNTIERSFRSNGRCFGCIGKEALALHWLVITHNVIPLVLGIDQPMYSLIENNTMYMLKLKLLSLPHSHGFDRPRLRLKSIPGTATGKLKHAYFFKNQFYRLLIFSCHYAESDFSLVTSELLLRNPVAGIDIDVTIADDGIAGEPLETFTITSQPPVVSSSADPLFLFRDTTITITDTNSE